MRGKVVMEDRCNGMKGLDSIILHTKYWILDIILHTKYWILDVRYFLLDTGLCWRAKSTKLMTGGFSLGSFGMAGDERHGPLTKLPFFTHFRLCLKN